MTERDRTRRRRRREIDREDSEDEADNRGSDPSGRDVRRADSPGEDDAETRVRRRRQDRSAPTDDVESGAAGGGFFETGATRETAAEPDDGGVGAEDPPAETDRQEPSTIELETAEPATERSRDRDRRHVPVVDRSDEPDPLKERILLRAVDAAAVAVTKWRAVHETPLRETVDRFASRHLGPRVRNREAELADYRERHVQARIDRDWDVQLAAGALLTGLGILGGFALAWPTASLLFGLPAIHGAVVAGVVAAWIAAVGYYWYTSGKVKMRTYQRRREIEKLLPQAVAYMFSHSQGQQTVPEIIENLAHERETYGAISEEFGIVHKEVSIFESDLRHALRKARETTPSANLSTFFDELINVIDTSGELTEFLRAKTEEYQSRSLIEEERFIGRLSLAAFGYTFAGVFVPVMAIIALVFLSMMGMDVIWLGLLLAWGYVSVLSIGTWLAVRILAVDDMDTAPTLSPSYAGPSTDDLSKCLGREESDGDGNRPGYGPDGTLHAHLDDPRRVESRVDGHGAALSARERRSLAGLGRALKVVGARRALDNAWETLNRQPLYTLLGTVPVSVLVVVGALATGLASVPWPGVVASPVRDTTVVLVAPLAIVLGPMWFFSRRLRKRDAAVRRDLPNMLRKLSSATEAGTPFVESIKTVGETADDDLSAELRLMRNELSTFFADLEDSLVRMANRVRNPRLTRVTTLLIEANTSSGNVQDILAVAARDAENSKRLDEKRFSRMERQMFVIVMGFFAFLVIAGAFQFFLLPHIVEALEFTGEVDPDRLRFFPRVDGAMFTLVMFHSAISIGLFSGLVAGKFGYDDARAGAGWALVQVLCAACVFWAAAILAG